MSPLVLARPRNAITGAGSGWPRVGAPITTFCRLIALLTAWSVANPEASRAASGFDSDSRQGLESHVIDVWQTERGLPQNHVTAIAQGHDGYLWLGTYEGLARFDGVRFITFSAAREPGLQSSRITSLFEDRAGNLWIGHEHGQLACYAGGRFSTVLAAPVSPRGSILALESDEKGDVWFVRKNGVAERLRDHAIVPSNKGLNLPSLCRQQGGPLWRIHSGQLTPLEDRSLAGFDSTLDAHADPAVNARVNANSSDDSAARARAFPLTNEFVMGACPGREGGLWILTGSRVRHWNPKGKGEIADLGPPPWGDQPIPRVLETRSGQLWIGTQELGLFVRLPSGRYLHYGLTNGLPGEWIRSMWEDREGTIWVGTGGGGLCALRPRRVQMLQAPDGWLGRGILSVSPGQGDEVWVGTEGAGIYRYAKGQFTRSGPENGLANPYVWAVLNHGGAVWAGTWGRGLFQRQGAQWVSVPGLNQDGLVVTALCPGRNGVLWVGTQNGLARLAEDRLDWIGTELISPEVRCVAEASNGAVWFGMSGGGLGLWQNGQARQFRKTEGLPSNDIWCLFPSANGSLWIGTVGGGLGRWRDGRLAVIGEQHGLPNEVICQIVDDGQDTLWLGTRGGIVRASRRELEECADGRRGTVSFFVYGKSDGLATLECSGGSQPSHGRMRDGRLLFPTTRGLALVDPSQLTTNQLAPPVLIESLNVSGHELVFAGQAPRTRIEVPPGRQRLEFRFTALTFIAPERVRFRHRLDGMDENWAEVIGQRTVSYNFLPPGHYVFRVQACNSDGVWNTAGASLAFRVLPHFWQALWFQAGLGLALVAGVGGGARVVTRRRYRQKLERMDRQRAIERERSRIARDIHDDLGASLTRITLLSQSAAEELGQPAVASAHLQRIDATAREVTKALEEIVWAVNPRHDSLDSLVTYLGRFAQDLTSAAGVQCRIDMPTELSPCPLTSEIRHNLFLAVKEALNNAIRHAGANRVTVALQLAPDGFALVVEDDGRGFDPARVGTVAAGGGLPATATPTESESGQGNGLGNMRRRLEEMGGRCEIASRLGVGTTVRFVIKTDDRAPSAASARLPS
jgi:signal transduction histidine kinase/ligand-binding sensor domain-containing protein